MKNKKKYLIILPLIIVFLIFFLTLQKSSDSGSMTLYVKERFVDFWEALGIPRIVLVKRWWYDFSNFRKLAHSVEYLILSLILTAVLIKINRKNAYLFSFLLCLCISTLDQVTRLFLPTRDFDYYDLFFDGLGYISGILIVMFFQVILTSHKNRHKLSGKHKTSLKKKVLSRFFKLIKIDYHHNKK